MSERIGHCYCRDAKVRWEVWSDGKAYADDSENSVCYRHEDSLWRFSLVSKRSFPVDATEKLENIYQRYLNNLLVGPVDPHRHLRRK